MIRPDSVEHLRRSLDNISEEEEPVWSQAGFVSVAWEIEDLLVCPDCCGLTHKGFWELHRDWHESQTKAAT